MNISDKFQAGLIEFRNGNYELAGALFQEVLEIDDQNHKAWNALGIVCSKLDKKGDAATCFENALMIEPGNITYQKNFDKTVSLSKKQVIIKPIKRNATVPPQKIETSKKVLPNLNIGNFNSSSNYSDQRYIDIIRGFLTTPIESFREIKERNWQEGFKVFLGISIIYGVLLNLAYVLMNDNPIKSDIFAFILILGVLAFILFLIIGLFIQLVLGQIIILLLGGKGGWKMTMNTLTYSIIPVFLLGWIPIIGPLAIFGTIYLYFVGIRENQEFSTSRAIIFAIIEGLFFIYIIYQCTGFFEGFYPSFKYGYNTTAPPSLKM
jgi:hypothetical protein